METSSVGHAYAVLRGYRFGDKAKASEFLESMHPIERTLRNRMESRNRGRSKKTYKLGRKPIRR